MRFARPILLFFLLALAHAGASADDIVSRLGQGSDGDASAFLILDDSPEAAAPVLEVADDLIGYARQFLGRPYRRGGKGPAGFDCSGFTSYVFRKFDIQLAASSSAQFRQGHPVATPDIRPGDLLFFSGRGTRSGVGHVGMAVEVESDGTVIFIHSATSGGIRYDRYPDGGYYSSRYMGARRMAQ